MLEKTKTFNNNANIYTAYTPISEQISDWLERNEHIHVKDIQLTEDSATLIYQEE